MSNQGKWQRNNAHFYHTRNNREGPSGEQVSDVLTCNLPVQHMHGWWNGNRFALLGWKNDLWLTYIWPRTENPLEQDWTMWKSYLTSALSLGQHNRLRLPLGNWARKMKDTDGFFIKTDGDHLLEHKQNKWYIYTRIPKWQWKLQFHKEYKSLEAIEIPRNWWKAKVIKTQTTITVTGSAEIEQDDNLNHQVENRFDID